MLDPEEKAGLALAGLALTTATLAEQVRRGKMSIAEMRAVIRDAHALVNDAAGFVVDQKVSETADDFLSLAEALAMPNSPRVRADEFWSGGS